MAKSKTVVKKDDTIQVIAGKDKGKRGRVLKVFPDQGRLIVEKVNYVKRHTRPTQENQQGGIIEKEGTIQVSNVMVICSKCDVPVRVRHHRLKDRKKVRACVKCGEPLEKA